VKRVFVSTPIKGISVSGDYLVIELASGIMTIEKPRYIGFYSPPGVLDSRDLAVLVGVLYFFLVTGVFIDLLNVASLSMWYALAIILSGLLLLALLITPKKNVLVIETSSKIYHFTCPSGVNEKLVREVVLKICSTREQVQLTSSTVS